MFVFVLFVFGRLNVKENSRFTISLLLLFLFCRLADNTRVRLFLPAKYQAQGPVVESFLGLSPYPKKHMIPCFLFTQVASPKKLNFLTIGIRATYAI